METINDFYIPIASLNHYDYCHYRFYLVYITHDFIDNEYTIEGGMIHARVDSGEETKRRDLLQIRSAWLRSEKYNLVGKSDMIEEKEGELYPVEYKRGAKGNWKNDKLQLMAQALCLEEMLNLEIKRGFIYYSLTNQREEVLLDEALRNYTINAIDSIRNIFTTRAKPSNTYSIRCKGCSLYPVCLPREVDKIKNYQSGLIKQKGQS